MVALLPVGAAQDILQRRTHRTCRLWRIVRSDGASYHLTDHDRSVMFRGATYGPVGSLLSSAVTKEKGLVPTVRDVRGHFLDGLVTMDDVRAGRWRNASVTEWQVDWAYPFLGPTNKRWFQIAGMSWDGDRFTADLRGLGDVLERTAGRRVSRTCGKKLETCGADLTGLVLTGATVASVTDDNLDFRTTSYTSLTLPGVTYAFGTVEFTAATNAANLGQRYQINTVDTDGTGVDIALQLPTPSAISAGDTFTLRPGCDKSFDGGCATYSNRALFGGFPHLPGSDRANEVP